MVWNETASFSDFLDPDKRGYFAQFKDPINFRTQQTTVSDFSFPTGTDVSRQLRQSRHPSLLSATLPLDPCNVAIIRQSPHGISDVMYGNSLPRLSPLPLRLPSRAQLRNALYGTGRGPANNLTVVYGYARGNLRPLNFSSGVSFRLQGANTRLYVDDQMIFDFQSDSQLMIVSPCITLQSNVPHEIYFYFAARVSSVILSPVTSSRHGVHVSAIVLHDTEEELEAWLPPRNQPGKSTPRVCPLPKANTLPFCVQTLHINHYQPGALQINVHFAFRPSVGAA